MDDYQLEKLYINAFSFIAFLIVAAIQFAIMYKFGVKGGIIFALAFSILFSFGSQIFLAWAKGMGDSRGIGSPYEYKVFSPQLLICLGLFTVYSFGLFFYVEYLKTGVLNKYIFFIWLAAFVAVPIIFFGLKGIRSYLEELDHKNNFINANVEISHYNELPLFIETLKIKNTIKDKESVVNIFNQSSYHSVEFINNMNVWDKVRMINQTEVPEDAFIPIHSDKLYISWYSPVEEAYYEDVLDFPFDEFKVWKLGNGTSTLNLKMEVLPGGKVHIYTTKHGKRFTYQIKPKELNEKGKDKFLELIHLYNVNIEKEIFSGTQNKIENKRRLEARIEQEEHLFNLRYIIRGPGELKSIHFEDRRYWGYDCSYSKLNTPGLKPLPQNITMYFVNTGKESYIRVYLYIDKERLFESIKKVTTGKEMPVEISISIKDSNKDNIKVSVMGKNKEVPFTDWDTNIVKGD